MSQANYLIFGDLHGRILPAYRLARAWSREHGIPLAGLLQVGDLGDSRFDERTSRRGGTDPLGGGARLMVEPTAEADAVFSTKACPGTLWFTAGNHEDYDLLKARDRRAGPSGESFAVDVYRKLRCIRDGRIATLPGDVRVAALWGIDDRAPRARDRIPSGGCISRRAAEVLSGASFDVLLTHDSPRDAVLTDNGSAAIGALINRAQPAFAFFGHYHRKGREITGEFGKTRVYHLSHLELDSRAEEGSVGRLTWDSGTGEFTYLDPAWLLTVTRHNWRHR